MYHFDADAAEHLHHKDNAKLQSQVRAGPAWTRSGAAAERRMRPPENANGLPKSSNSVSSGFIELVKHEPYFNVKAFYNITVTSHNSELPICELIK